MKKQIEIFLPTEFGNFTSSIYTDSMQKEHIMMIHENTDVNQPILLRIHSECLTGDLFHSLRCDCGYQLRESLNMIKTDGGILIYLRQEGRGIGLTQKYFAYKFQDMGYDTIEANLKLGFSADLRSFVAAADMLKQNNVKKVRLITNNPQKIKDLQENHIEVVECIPLVSMPNPYNKDYLTAKREKLRRYTRCLMST
jgi:3,4-dihydroxy 2-butanone 4-phosphate synthase/GTP cyclohydrolase II